MSAPVCTEISDFLAQPGSGPGIYNRCAVGEGGQAPGQAKSYDVTISRTSGLPGNRLHWLAWVGNDGTFSSAGSVRLPLGQAVTVPVQATGTTGAHGALLLVDDPGTRRLDHAIMNTVVVPASLAAPSYEFQTSSTVERNRHQSCFITVPEGCDCPAGQPCRGRTEQPDPVHRHAPVRCAARLDVEPHLLHQLLRSGGVRPDLPGLPGPDARCLGDRGGVPAYVAELGPVTVTPTGGPLGSAHTERPTIADGQQLQFTVQVPRGASRLDVSIGNPSDLAADLDLFVSLGDQPVAQDADGDSEESVSIADPEPGSYTVEIDGFEVPAGTTFDYRDVFYSASLGSVDVTGAPITLTSGASATVDGTVTANEPPAPGRQLFGEMTLVTDAGAVIGRGGVLIKDVTPVL